jgi:acetyl-CoA carboxylase biotin carboxylase subunit
MLAAIGRDVIHCFVRECSLQRRRQKVWEEAPSPSLTPDVRDKLCSSAVALAKAVDYRGAGTLRSAWTRPNLSFVCP